MAKSRMIPEKLPPPRLLGSREEAKAQLEDRVEKGLTLRDRQILSSENLQQAWNDRRKWSDFNTELLTRLFDNESIANEYARTPGAGFITLDPSFKERLDDFRDEMDTSITRLESVVERLELIPSVNTGSNATPATVGDLGRKVFLVHGHDEAARQSVARFLERLNLQPIVLHEQPNRGQTIIEKFERYSDVAFAVVLLTPDDLGSTKLSTESLRDRARQNVILELGYFLGKLDRGRVCALYWDDVELPSDYLGVLYVPFDASGGWRLRLAAELKAAGINIDMNKAL